MFSFNICQISNNFVIFSQTFTKNFRKTITRSRYFWHPQKGIKKSTPSRRGSSGFTVRCGSAPDRQKSGHPHLPWTCSSSLHIPPFLNFHPDYTSAFEGLQGGNCDFFVNSVSSAFIRAGVGLPHTLRNSCFFSAKWRNLFTFRRDITII